MTGLEIFFLILGVIGIAILLAILTAIEDFTNYGLVILFIAIGAGLFGGSLYGCHGYGYKDKEISYVKTKVVDSKEMGDSVILQLDDKTILVKKEIEWMKNKDNIYKKMITNNFGKISEEYVVGKK